MKTRKVPMRQCIGCGERKEKQELVRILRLPEGTVILDTTGKKNGRGAYICNSTACLAKAKKRHSLDRAFKMSLQDDIYEQLEKELEDIADKS